MSSMYAIKDVGVYQLYEVTVKLDATKIPQLEDVRHRPFTPEVLSVTWTKPDGNRWTYFLVNVFGELIRDEPLGGRTSLQWHNRYGFPIVPRWVQEIITETQPDRKQD